MTPRFLLAAAAAAAASVAHGFVLAAGGPQSSARPFAAHRAFALRAGGASGSEASVAVAGYPNLTPSTFGGIPYSSCPSSVGRIYRTIFILGGPGAGKGTQSGLITDHYPAGGSYVCHLSVGDLLRAAREAGGDDAELIEGYIVAGKIVPVEVSLNLLRKAMDAVCDDAVSPPIFLVDGFPRNDDNLDGWEKIMGDCSALVATLVYDCPPEELERRILERAKTSGRSDDNVESLRKRFRTFETETQPVTLRLAETDRCPVHRIDGDRSIEEVWADTRQVLDGVVVGDVLAANAALLEGDGAEGAAVEVTGGGEVTVSYVRTGTGEAETRRWTYQENGWTSASLEEEPVKD